ncbi:MAG TPA: DUF302 domain-containing protein [Gammaproteobacteria bacterium]|nr:DUF302 domain-containing protein [Gammaproteobacteria bacterium]
MKHTYSAVTLASLFALTSVFIGWQVVNSKQLPTLLRLESPYTLSETINNIKNAVKARNFRMIREQPVAQGFLSGDNKQQHIVYFCNFTEAYQSLQQDKQIGYMLPCRFTISEEGGKVIISTINPAAITRLTGAKAGAVCAANSAGYLDIMEEAVL